MNQKDVEADCSAMIDIDSEYSRMESFLSSDKLFICRRSQSARAEARMQRKNDRMQRRINRINKL